MVKTNYTKVEELLIDGLHKQNMQMLLKLADQTQAESSLTPHEHGIMLTEARRLVLAALKQDIRHLKKQKVKLEAQFGIRKKGIEKLIEHPELLTPEEWEKIKVVQKQVADFKKELMKKLPISTDEQLVQAERKKHINKRHNTNEKWLPLH